LLQNESVALIFSRGPESKRYLYLQEHLASPGVKCIAVVKSWRTGPKEMTMRSFVINAMRGLSVITIILSSLIVIFALAWLAAGARVSYTIVSADGEVGMACGSLLHSAGLKWVLLQTLGLPTALIGGAAVLLRESSRQMARMLSSWKHLLIVLVLPLLAAAAFVVGVIIINIF